MATPVNSEGRPGQSYEPKIAYVEWLAQDLVRQATRTVLAAKLEKMRPAIEKAVEDALRAGIKQTSKALTDAFIKNSSHGYGVTIHVAVAPRS